MINLLCNKYSIELAYNLTVPTTSDLSAEFSPIVNEISAMNTIAPIYLLAQSSETKKLAFEIKDLSTSIRDQLAAMYKPDDEAGQRKPYMYYSNAPKCISLETLEQPEKDAYYHLHIDSVADGQINIGKNVPAKSCPFRGGTYKFIIIKDEEYFHYQIDLESTSTNEDILSAMSNEINDSEIGINCFLTSADEKVSLTLHALPNKQDNPATFKILEDGARIVHFYNLNKIASEPVKSYFSINKEEFSSFGTVFLVDDYFKLTLHNKDKEDIRIYADEVISDTKPYIDELLQTANTLLQLSVQISEHKLHRELITLIDSCRDNFENLGIEVNPSYSLELSENTNSLTAGGSFTSQAEEHVIPEVLDCISKISTNPIDYLPKKVVSYPDLSKPNWAKPYQLSNYTGFLFSGYC